MGFLTDLVTGGIYEAYWNHEYRAICKRIGIPAYPSCPDDEEKEDVTDTKEPISSVQKPRKSMKRMIADLSRNNLSENFGMDTSIEAAEDGNKGAEDESNNLSAYTKVHWDEKLE